MAWYVFSYSTLCADRSLPQIAEYGITATLGTIVGAEVGKLFTPKKQPREAEPAREADADLGAE